MRHYPDQQLTSIGAIYPDAAQFLARPAQATKQQTRSCRIGHRGGGDRHCQHQTQSIDQQVPLAPLDLFAAVIAAHACYLRGLDALAVQRPGCGMLVPPCFLPYLCPQPLMNASPRRRRAICQSSNTRSTGYSRGSSRHAMPPTSRYSRALTTWRISSRRGLPRRLPQESGL